MSDSILTSTKKNLNLAEDYEAFDADVIMHINSVFSQLSQLGVGPAQGFMIVDKEDLWTTFLVGDPRLNWIKTYVFLKVRMVFDPPTIAALITAMEKQISELEWRISIQREETEWTDPETGLALQGEILDGGTP